MNNKSYSVSALNNFLRYDHAHLMCSVYDHYSKEINTFSVLIHVNDESENSISPDLKKMYKFPVGTISEPDFHTGSDKVWFCYADSDKVFIDYGLECVIYKLLDTNSSQAFSTHHNKSVLDVLVNDIRSGLSVSKEVEEFEDSDNLYVIDMMINTRHVKTIFNETEQSQIFFDDYVSKLMHKKLVKLYKHDKSYIPRDQIVIV